MRARGTGSKNWFRLCWPGLQPLATIALFAVPSFSRPAFWVSYLIAAVFALCAGVALLFWRDADQALKGEHRED